MDNARLQQLVDEFYRIREIPYRIPVSVEEEDHCCNGKSKQLFSICEKLSIPCRYRVIEFLRNDFELPTNVRRVFHENLGIHVFLEIEIDGERLCVDPTRDSGLSSLFPVTEREGRSNTYFGVKPLRFYDLRRSEEIMTGEHTRQEMEDDLKLHGKFYEAFNERLEQLRHD